MSNQATALIPKGAESIFIPCQTQVTMPWDTWIHIAPNGMLHSGSAYRSFYGHRTNHSHKSRRFPNTFAQAVTIVPMSQDPRTYTFTGTEFIAWLGHV